MFLNRLCYYLESIPKILLNFRGLLRFFFTRGRRCAGAREIISLPKLGLRFKVRSLMDIWIIKENCLDRDYERSPIDFFDGMTVLDIGAGIGEFSVDLAKSSPKAKIFALEPFPESFTLLCENLKLNSIQNVTPLALAISSKADNVTLFSNQTNPSANTTVDSVQSGSESISVPAVSLEDFIQIYAPNGLDLIKLDCEGAEFEILLQSNKNVFKKIGGIALEYHNGVTQYTDHNLQSYLEELGYTVASYPSRARKGQGFLLARMNS